MSEQLRQQLSALMDGEADAADIDALLENVDDPDLRGAWRRYHLARESHSATAGLASADISGRIMAAIAEEPAHSRLMEESPVSEPVPDIRPVGRWQQFMRPLASLAVAASVAAIVVLGTQYAGLGVGDAPAIDSAETVVVADNSSPVTLLGGGVANLAGYAAPAVASPSPQRAPTADYTDYNALARERLRRYLLSHAKDASINTPQGTMPYARVATFESED